MNDEVYHYGFLDLHLWCALAMLFRLGQPVSHRQFYSFSINLLKLVFYNNQAAEIRILLQLSRSFMFVCLIELIDVLIVAV